MAKASKKSKATLLSNSFPDAKAEARKLGRDAATITLTSQIVELVSPYRDHESKLTELRRES